jgi:cyclopropane fatty-acyl-phospholipid synthase-like methyltransferase
MGGITSDDVARYYDRNTARFLLVGRGGVHAMHRELWGPGVRTAREAADHVNALVAAELAHLQKKPSALVLDFGCGVGGTLFRLAEWLPRARFHGITVSRRQHDVAVRLGEELGWAARCSFAHGDFHTASLGEVGEAADAVLAIESFAHSTSPAAFLENAARHLVRGGLLVVADDFLARAESSLTPVQRRTVERFRRGWRVPAVDTAETLVEQAADHGLEALKNQDLTPLTRPGSRLRDRAIAAAQPALARLDLARLPFFGNLIGGHALQSGLRDGFLEYRLLVFRRVA